MMCPEAWAADDDATTTTARYRPRTAARRALRFILLNLPEWRGSPTQLSATECRTPSAGWGSPGVDRPLGRERPLVRGPCFAAGHIVRQVGELVQEARGSQPEQHRHHHEVARAERPIEPVGVVQAGGELVEPTADAVLDQRQALLRPGAGAPPGLYGHELGGRRAPRGA